VNRSYSTSLAFLLTIAAATTAVVAKQDGDSAESSPARASATTMRDERTWLEMKNVNLRVADNAVVGIRQLRGEVIPTRAGSSALLDSTSSFSIRITSGSVAISSADLGVILNRFVFGYKGSPLRNLHVRSDGAQLNLTGVMHKGVDVKFEISSTPTLTDSGWIKLSPYQGSGARRERPGVTPRTWIAPRQHAEPQGISCGASTR
jgi:hypothetical protein